MVNKKGWGKEVLSMAGSSLKLITLIGITGCILLLLDHSAHAQVKYVTAARSFTARDYDTTLPAEPIDQWLKSHFPKGMVAAWEPQKRGGRSEARREQRGNLTRLGSIS